MHKFIKMTDLNNGKDKVRSKSDICFNKIRQSL